MNQPFPSMNAEHDLIEAYHEWRRLADAVGEGIAAGDWNRVAAGQRAIVELQKRISGLSPQVRAERTQAGPAGAIKETILDQLIEDLMILTRRHQAALAERKQMAWRQLEQTGVVSRNLKRIKSSYVVSRPGCRTAFA